MHFAKRALASVAFVLLTVPVVNAQNAAPAAAEGQKLSANAFYQEFQDNELDAEARYAGRPVVLEGLRGELVLMPNGVQASVHVAAGRRTDALILVFSDRNQLRGIGRGQRFRFKCVLDKYKHGTVWMADCSIERSTPAASETPKPGPTATVHADIPSANAFYREFQDNEVDATRQYVRRSVALEGIRGDLILMSPGAGAAVHIADRGRSNALILQFADRGVLRGIDQGQRFRFRCTVEEYKYRVVWMTDCSIER